MEEDGYFILLRVMRKNSQQLIRPRHINKSSPRRLEEKGFSGIENNMDVDGYSWVFSGGKLKVLHTSKKGVSPAKKFGTREWCISLSSVLDNLHVPTPPPLPSCVLSHTSLFCPIPGIWPLQSTSPRIFCPLPSYCVWPLGSTGKKVGREHTMDFIHPTLLK